MENDLDEIVFNIRACVQSNKGPMSLRNLSRDYETIVSGEIPFRKFNYKSLEEFLRSLPTLKVYGSGGQATVEVASTNESKHITSLISKQKTTTKKFAPPPRKSYPQSTYRGRGASRGRGRGGYSSKPLISHKDYGNYQDKEFRQRDQSDYRMREQSNFYSREQSDFYSRDQSDFRMREYQNDSNMRDESNIRARDHQSDFCSGDYNLPKRYSPSLPKRQDQGPLTIKLDGEDKRQVSLRKSKLPPRLQRKKSVETEYNAINNSYTPPEPALSPGSQVTVEILCLGSSLAGNLMEYLQKDQTYSSLLKVSKFFHFPGTKIRTIELEMTNCKHNFNPKIPLMVMLGEDDIFLTTEKTKEIGKHYLSLVLLLRKLCPGIKLILIDLPICICSHSKQNHLERLKSFNEFLLHGLHNPSNHIYVVSLNKVLDKFEFYNCDGKKLKQPGQVDYHLNESGYSTLMSFLNAHLKQGLDTDFFLDQISTNSAYGPSKLIERAKERAAKQERFQSDFLLQPSVQETMALVTDFTRLSHQDSFDSANGNLISPLVEQNMNEDPMATPALQQEDLLPQPDDNDITNNIAILLRYCSLRGWTVPTYRVLKNPSQPKMCFASVKVHGDGENNFTVNSLPLEHENASIVKGFAAKKALEKILAEELKKVKANKVISSDKNIVIARISDIVRGSSSGLFTKSVEDEYISRHNELLPDHWLDIVGSSPLLSVESTINRTIILPRDPPPPLELLPPSQVEQPQTFVPPPLPIEDLGNGDSPDEYVYITNATSVNNVWFRVIGHNYSDEYDILLKNMDTYYKGEGAKDLALTHEIDNYYSAHDTENDTWFRVCVTEVDEASQVVLSWLVDLGDHQSFPFGSLYKLAPQFCLLPQQAVMCGLENLDIYDFESANEVVSTSDLLCGKSLIAKITSKDQESGYMKAILYDTSGEDDVEVNDELESEIIAKTSPVLPAESSVTQASIAYVSKKGEIFVTFNNPMSEFVQELCNSMASKIDEHKLTSFKNISLTKIYLAKFHQDLNWYRAVVTTTPSLQHNQIPIRFIDYGNTESVSISDIADMENLPSILNKLPVQAVKVALHNLPLETLTNSEVARLHALLLDEEKEVLVRTVSLKTNPPEVEIFIKNEKGGLVSVNSSIEVMRAMNEKNKISKNAASSESDHQSRPVTNQDDFVLKSPDLGDSNFLPVLVVLAAHPGNFIFQPKKYAKELKTLKGQMTAYYEAGAMPELTVDRILKNKLFAARHHADNLWYRVLVTDSPMGSRVPVRLIDHGDVTCVTISSLRELAPEFHVYPFMAIKGKLAGVKPRHGDWSVEDCIRFHDLAVKELLAATIISIQANNEDPMDMVVSLELVDTREQEDKDIAEILIQEQRAVREI